MIGFIIRYIIIACVVLIIPRYLKGITVDGFTTALIVALAMGFLNSFVKPILKIISFTITFMTLGLFSLVITVATVAINSRRKARTDGSSACSTGQDW